MFERGRLIQASGDKDDSGIERPFELAAHRQAGRALVATKARGIERTVHSGASDTLKTWRVKTVVSYDASRGSCDVRRISRHEAGTQASSCPTGCGDAVVGPDLVCGVMHMRDADGWQFGAGQQVV